LQRRSNLDIEACVAAAKDTIRLVTVQTDPVKIAAKLTGDTTEAHSDVSALETAVAAYNEMCSENALLSVLYEAASIAAQRAYMCYQSKAIFQTQKQGNSSSSGGTSNPKTNNIELCRPVQQKLNQKIKLLKR
jgi:hypothetical protein